MGRRPGSHIRNPLRGPVSSSVSSWLNFTPLSLSPQLWLDAADIATITESGGSVSQWNDKSGNGFDVAQGTGANQPTLITAGQNGLDVIDFNGTSHNLIRTASMPLVKDVAGATVYVVRSSDVNATASRACFALATATSTTARIQIGAGFASGRLFAGGRRLDGNAFQRVDDGTAMLVSTWQIQTGRFVYTETDLRIFVDRTQGGLLSTFQTVGNTSDTNSARITVGAGQSLTALWDGQIAEILLFGEAHTFNQLQTVWGYLAYKWGLQI